MKAPETLTPSQSAWLHATDREKALALCRRLAKQAPDTPEHRLWVAVFTQTVRDAMREDDERHWGDHHPHIRWEAREYLANDLGQVVPPGFREDYVRRLFRMAGVPLEGLAEPESVG